VVKLHSALARDGKANEGESRLKEWLVKHPTDAGTRSYLAEQFISTKRYRESIEHYEYLAKQRSSDFVALNNLAWAYMQVKDKRAVVTAERALKLSPENAAVLDTLGMVLLSEGENDRAVEILRKAAAAAPKSPEVRYHYVQALVNIGDRKGALAELEHLLVASPNFSESKAALGLLAALRK
jgi:predicted Zn-dependent protease